MEPPADIEQNSNNPSNTGQSSPTLPVVCHKREQLEPTEVRTFVLLFDVRIHVPWGYAGEELHIFVGVELCHFPFRGRFGSLASDVRNGSQSRQLWMRTNISILLYKP